MEQNTPSLVRRWWSDDRWWMGFIAGIAVVWAYKLGRKLGYLEARDE